LTEMKTLYVCCLKIGAEELVKRLRKDPGKKVVFMDWPDIEIIEAFNAGEYTDLVTTYRPARASGFKTNADAIIHHDLPPGHKEDQFVKDVNNRAPGASIVYRFNDHFEYEGFTV